MTKKRYTELILCLLVVATVSFFLHRDSQRRWQQQQQEQAQAERAQAELQAQFEKALESGKEFALNAPRTVLEHSVYGMSGEDHRRFWALSKEMDTLNEEYDELLEQPTSAANEARLEEISQRLSACYQEMLEILD